MHVRNVYKSKGHRASYARCVYCCYLFLLENIITNSSPGRNPCSGSRFRTCSPTCTCPYEINFLS